jgi:hypothetical protein
MPLIIEKKNIVGDMKTAAAGAARCRETWTMHHRHIYTHIISSGKVLYPEVFFFCCFCFDRDSISLFWFWPCPSRHSCLCTQEEREPIFYIPELLLLLLLLLRLLHMLCWGFRCHCLVIVGDTMDLYVCVCVSAPR